MSEQHKDTAIEQLRRALLKYPPIEGREAPRDLNLLTLQALVEVIARVEALEVTCYAIGAQIGERL